MNKRKLSILVAMVITIASTVPQLVSATDNINNSTEVTEEVESGEVEIEDTVEEVEKALLIQEIDDIKPIRIMKGTQNKEVMELLPETIGATVLNTETNEESKEQLSIKWNMGGFIGSKPGEYTITGKLVSDKDIDNIKEHEASVVVTVLDKVEGLEVTVTPIEDSERSRVKIVFGDETVNQEVTILISDSETEKVLLVDQLSSENGFIIFETALEAGSYEGFLNAMPQDSEYDNGKIPFEFIIE